MKRHKNGFFTSLILMLLSIMAMAFVGCNKEIKPEVSFADAGEYYCTVSDTSEYLLKLTEDGNVEFKVDDKNLTGNFTITDKNITITLSDNTTINAVFEDKTIKFTYNEKELLFYPNVNCTVTLVTNSDSEMEPLSVRCGKLATKPENPVYKDHKFMGWCADEELKNIFDFESVVITKDISIYAKWDYIERSSVITYLTTEEIKTINEKATVKNNLDYTLDIPTVPQGNQFIGWFDLDTGEQLTNETGKSLAPWDADMGDITVEARYEIALKYEELDDGTYRASGSVFTTEFNEIEIPETHKDMAITEVGNFPGHANLVSLLMPNTVKFIYERAFVDSPLLSRFDVYEVEGNDKATFKSVDGVIYTVDDRELVRYPVSKEGAEYKVPASVTKIGDSAFYQVFADKSEGYSQLRKVVLPKNLTTVGEFAFYELIKLGTVLFDGEGTLPLTFERGAFCCTGLREYNEAEQTGFKIPNNIYEIGPEAFRSEGRFYEDICSFNRNFVLPEGLKIIGERAFEWNRNIESVTFPASVEELGVGMFGNCWILNEVIFVEGSQLEVIPESAFSRAPMKKIVFPDHLKEIGAYAFKEANLTEIVLPETVVTIGSHAFCDMRSLESVTIPSSVINMGNGVFSNCGNLKVEKITIPETLGKIIDGVLYTADLKHILIFPKDFDKEEYIMPDTVETMPDSIFYRNKTLKKIHLSNNLKYIPAKFFGNTSALESIIIPASVERIEKEAFSYSAIKNVTFEEGSKLKFIAESAFARTNIASIALPEGLEVLGQKVFYKCGELTEMVIPSTVTTLGDGLFDSCKKLEKVVLPESLVTVGRDIFSNVPLLNNLEISENNLIFKTIDGNLYNVDGTKLIQYSKGKTDEKFVLPNSVVEIGANAFEGNEFIKTVVSDSSLKKIGESAFRDCINLTTLDISGVTSLGANAFNGCKALVINEIPKNLKFIPDAAFKGCEKLEKADLSRVERIGKSAFEDCISLKEFKLNRKIKKLPDRIFSNCGFVQITIPGTVKEIGSSALSNNQKLTKIVLSYGVEKVNSWALGYNPVLTEIVFPETLTVMESGVCDTDTALKTITLPVNLKELGGRPFAHCYSLTEINISENNPNFKSVDGNLYTKDCSDLVFYALGKTADTFEIPSTIKEMKGNPFFNYISSNSSNELRFINLKNLIFGENLESISSHTLYSFFAYGNKWEKIHALDSITVYNQKLFDNCMFSPDRNNDFFMDKATKKIRLAKNIVVSAEVETKLNEKGFTKQANEGDFQVYTWKDKK